MIIWLRKADVFVINGSQQVSEGDRENTKKNISIAKLRTLANAMA